MDEASARRLPMIIQGGMGIGVSNWTLARAVSRLGQLGVVSGTCIDSVLVRRLQDGDIGGHVRRAMEHFPIRGVAEDVLHRYFLPGGRLENTPYKLLPLWKQVVADARERLTMMAAFVEVYLAKEGHDGFVGINLLTKVQMPNLPTLYGAMLAGVSCVLMGAGIPKEIPGVLDAFSEHQPAMLRFDVEGLARGEAEALRFDPRRHFAGEPPAVMRPLFLPIVASHSLATMLARKSNGRVDGFVVEGPIAGGHNAPPRGRLELNPRGEPIYGERDLVDVEEMKALGLPFWLAGGTGSPDGLANALEQGAAGVQVGTLFAYSDESGLDPELKRQVLRNVRSGEIDVLTDPLASPTGFPFKVVTLDGTLSGDAAYAARERVCNLGYLRIAYKREDGRIGYRCAAEPVDAYVEKGGTVENTVGRKCLCNALMANIGLAQIGAGTTEQPLLTSGDELRNLGEFLGERHGYSAADAIEHLLSRVPAGVAVA
jgi:NAD(P)H-dependent flavin oxidoreductase YrpB (nitropropane dioxygenase family)